MAQVTTFTGAGVQTDTSMLFVAIDLGMAPTLTEFERNVAALRMVVNHVGVILEARNEPADSLSEFYQTDRTSSFGGSVEVSMLTLHLLQSSLVYIQTLLLPRVLSEPKWAKN
jgi:hypothetical protein